MIQQPTPAPGVLAEELEDGACLCLVDGREVLMLNETAADVWRLADGTRSTAEIVELLAAAYGTYPKQIQADVQALVADLVARGYLVEDPSALAAK